MISELPGLFGKNFAIGFFLPAIIIVAGVNLLLVAFGLSNLGDAADPLQDVTIAALLAWVLAVALMALSRPLVRFLEGYGDHNPLRRLFLASEQKHFTDHVAPLLKLANDIDAARAAGQPEPAAGADFSGKLSAAASRYPDRIEFVMPTRLGNIMRAFEVYPRVVYELESILAWPRLMMIVPEAARKQVDDSRAVVDFAINLLVAGVVILAVYLVLALYLQEWPALWVPPSALLACIGAWHLIQQSALQWGEEVKAVFDLYREALAGQVGLDLPLDSAQETVMWRALSRMMVFRSRSAYAALRPFRTRPKPAAGSAADPDAP